MFLNFGKKSSNKKPATPAGSPKTPSSPNINSPGTGGAASRSTVQTIAGPLLSSSRFNTVLDASTYANVNSPGFTSRVVNCATNGSSSSSYRENSATHQSKYSSVGLFPRVQLGQSILPTLSPHNSQKVRTPVRVRIAPPSLISRRQNSVCTPPESIKEKNDTPKLSPSSSLQKSTNGSSSRKNDHSCSVIENLQEASRKRIFSECQDVSDESKKRRRKAELPIPNPNDDTYHYRHVRAPAVPSRPPQPDISSQGKRAREKGSPEEQKRQRRKVCNTNNAIFSSLSSSRNLLERITAQKRKSVDSSRSSSPLTPLSAKQVKDRKTASNAKSTQCNLDNLPPQEKFSGETHQADGTPVSSKGILKRVSFQVKETTTVSQEKSQDNAAPDYTTKLFRKEVSSHTPRTPSSKTPKQSLWVQPSEADELNSFLNDDSKLHRPERLKSLLARVSGKDNRQENKTPLTATSTGAAVATLPVSTGPKQFSPSGGLSSGSSALTVTVSSTCTIMTSATVTSVNGIPSSESGSSPRPLVSASLSSTALLPISQPAVSLESVETAVKAPPPSSIVPPATQVTSQSLVQGQVVSLSTPLFTSSSPAQPTASTGIGLGTTTSSVPKDVTPSSNVFSIKASTTSSETLQMGTAIIGTAATKPTFQFGSSTQASQAASPLSTVAPPSLTNSAFKFASGTSNLAATPVPTFGASSTAAKPIVSFGSSGDPKPAFQLDTSASAVKSTGSDPATPAKPTFSFGSSAGMSSGVPTTAFQLGQGLSETSKPAFQFGSSLANNTSTSTTVQQGSTGIGTNASAQATKSAFQFGSSATTSPTPAFQLGGASGLPAAPSASFQFGSSSTNQGPPSEAPKSAFQFTSSKPSNNGSSDAQKPNFSFGSSSGASKPNLQFGSNNTSSLEVTKSTPSFGSSNSLTTPAKPTFQFGGGSNGPAATAPANSAFQFSSVNSSDQAKPAFGFGSSVSKPTDLSRPAFGSTVQSPTSAFGQAAPQQTKPAFAFGSPANQNTNGPNENKSAFSFSSPTNNKGAFSFGASTNSSTNGSTDNKSAFSFGSSNPSMSRPADNKSSFSFGASSNASTNGPSDNKGAFSFSTSANQSTNGSADSKGAFSFGSSGPTFGSGTPNSSFGSGPSSSAFGAPASNTPSALPSFGSISESKTNGFGSTPSFGSTGSSSFSFASNSSTSNGNSGSAFAFGGGSSGNTNGAFSFGQKQDQASSGFSFNATVTAVPNSAQATQAPGLFSIGAGASTTQRRVRDARRRR
ncbi:nuclear envelope pore membrane protein POM 121-like [Thrips palmi]|uniref:Nuclear envelope pore membrane protein POM 121-like n=1 Tax=Thrips palmi TaxID=161013 RepID=A0A6P8ZHD7_THRPL|nr:nuclear envelope pore membrane protein POM 121-like [Thrips palmi]